MTRLYLNLTSTAWRQLRRNWKLPANPLLLWQTLVPGTVFSGISKMQKLVAGEKLSKANLRDAIVVLGYWRSGTTLLHELLCLDTRYTFPTTHACMNPHNFLFTEASALARSGAIIQRPMDEMELRSGSPQEDEFALLCLGARSPYEALVRPSILSEALKLADPKDLSPQDENMWREVFISFLSGVSARGNGRPMILKSPTHGTRLSTLRELLPDARYVLISRDPLTNFESVVRMWKKMFESYAIGPMISDDEIREAVLLDRPRFEAKLATGVEGLGKNRFVAFSYEQLLANPVGVLEGLYERLELGDFGLVREAIANEMVRRKSHKARGILPSPEWQERIRRDWAALFAQHQALGRRMNPKPPLARIDFSSIGNQGRVT